MGAVVRQEPQALVPERETRSDCRGQRTSLVRISAAWGGLSMRRRSRTDQANELDFDPSMLESPAIFGTNSYCAFHRLAIHIEGCLLAAVLVQLDIDGLAVVGLLEHDVDVDRSREEVRRHDGGGDCWKPQADPTSTTVVLK